MDPKTRRFMEHGKRIEYTDDGQVLEEEQYLLGKRDGLQKYYDRTRNMVMEVIYHKEKLAKRTLKKTDGTLVGWEEYFPDGSVKASKGSIKIE